MTSSDQDQQPYGWPTGSPRCVVCGGSTDGTASVDASTLAADEHGRVHVACAPFIVCAQPDYVRPGTPGAPPRRQPLSGDQGAAGLALLLVLVTLALGLVMGGIALEQLVPGLADLGTHAPQAPAATDVR